MSDATLPLLRASDVLRGLDEDTLTALDACLCPASVEAGATIVREGEHADCWYLIVDGTAAVTHIDLRGEQVTLAMLGPGDGFGERALVADDPRRLATVCAVTPVQLARLDAADFRRIVGDSLEANVECRLRLMAVDAALKRASPFARLPNAAIWSLAEQLRSITARTGDTIVQQNEPGDCFYLIRTGSVAVLRDGRRIATLAAGDSFGEVALLARTPRIATVQALQDTDLLVLTRDDFQRVANEQHSVANYFRELIGVRFRGAAGQRLLLPDPLATVMPLVGQERRKRYWLVFLVGIIVFGLATLGAIGSGNPAALYGALIVGSCIGPVVFVYYLWESRILTERPVELVITAALGAILGLPLAIWLQRELGIVPGTLTSALLVGVIEEPAKALGVAWLLPRRALRFRMDGVILGAAAGMGFAAIESALYGLARVETVSALIGVLWVRALLSPFTHGTWTALVCATIWRARTAHRRDAVLRISGALLAVMLLHALWDWRALPLPWNFAWLLGVGVASILALRWILQRASDEEARAVSALAPEIARAAHGAIALRCPGCGRRAPAGARYCPRCGLALRLATQQRNKAGGRRSWRTSTGRSSS